MIHHETIERYPGTLSELACDLGDLRYDALERFLRLLACKLDADSTQDEGRGRQQLAAALRESAQHLTASAASIERAWRISEPHM